METIESLIKQANMTRFINEVNALYGNRYQPTKSCAGLRSSSGILPALWNFCE